MKEIETFEGKLGEIIVPLDFKHTQDPFADIERLRLRIQESMAMPAEWLKPRAKQ